METIPKKKNHKRKAEEINSDSGAVAEEDHEISKADDSGPLGLCDDIVLGEVITQFPWYNLRVVAGLGPWWAHAMEHSFPYYARLRNPRVLSNSLVLFHTPNPGNDAYDNTLSLWVYSDDEGAVFNLSVPDIPEGLRSDVKFVTDLNDDRIYSFIPVDENGREMYDVRVVDLREGNLRWKKLMPLPVLEEQFVSSCSSIDNGGSSTTYHILWVPSGFDDLDEEDISVWTLKERNGITEWRTQWELELAPSPDLIDKLIGFDSEKVRPIYLEIDITADSGHNARKCLYKMCEHSEYSTRYISLLDLPHFLLLQFQDSEDEKRTEQRTTGSNNSILYYIRASEAEGVCEVSIYRAELDDNNIARIELETEWDAFWEIWIPALEERVETTAAKILSKIPSQWEKMTFNIDKVLDIHAIKLSPKGGLYVYSLETAFLQRS